MADATSAIGGLGGLTGTAKSDAAKSNEAVDKNEFLQLLVTQLKNQDPLNPMENQEFAVQLAQFSQLEQLVSINGKIGENSSAGDMASLASFLGHDVFLDSQTVSISDHDGGKVAFNLQDTASDVQVQLLGPGGDVRGARSLGPTAGGSHVVDLNNLNLESGTYQVQVVAASAIGGSVTVDARVGGAVSGFIPGADPKLIVNGLEVSTSEIKEVRTASH